MPGKLDWFRFYVNDWLLDTMAMTLEQQGAYARLLCFQWRDGFLSSEPAVLAELCNVTSARFTRHVWPALEKHFGRSKLGLRNLRLERERTEMDSVRVMNQQKGRRSGEVRRIKAKAGKDLGHEQRLNRGSISVEPNANELEIEKEREDHDLDLDLTPDRIGATPGSQNRVAGESGQEQEPIPPPPNVLAKMGALVMAARDRELPERSTSIPKDDFLQQRAWVNFIRPLYPETQPGAGLPRHVVEWEGRIPLGKRAAVARELPRQRYRAEDGTDLPWKDLTLGQRKQIMQGTMRGLLENRGGTEEDASFGSHGIAT